MVIYIVCIHFYLLLIIVHAEVKLIGYSYKLAKLWMKHDQVWEVLIHHTLQEEI